MPKNKCVANFLLNFQQYFTTVLFLFNSKFDHYIRYIVVQFLVFTTSDALHTKEENMNIIQKIISQP